jgi:hypothetical protein
VASSITGSSVTRAVGGGPGLSSSTGSTDPNPGSGGGGGQQGGSGTGGVAGIVFLRYSPALTITIGAGLTGTTTTVGSNRVTTITAGTGNVSFA